MDRILSSVEAGQEIVDLGDVRVPVTHLKTFRNQLAFDQTSFAKDRPGHEPSFLIWTNVPPWLNGNVHYKFDPTQVSNNSITAAKMRAFRDAVGEWAAAANLRFIEFSSNPPSHYITVQYDPNLVGGKFVYGSGQQFIQLGPNDWNHPVICHEVGHALGLNHEQQRPDRDSYVTILWNNIAAANQGTFTKVTSEWATYGAYDFHSVMHYTRNFHAIDPNQDTMQPQPAYNQFLNIMGYNRAGRDRTLSKSDRAGMANFYGNPTPLPSGLVTNTKESGPGSLRAALAYAFDRSTDTPPVATTVTFQIPTSDPGFNGTVFTIKPTDIMFAPGSGTTIDGTTQTAFTGDTNPSGPEIVVNGSLLPQQGISAPGLILREANCTLKGLVINGFNQQGVLISGAAATANVITGCYIGTDPTGSIGVANTLSGIEILGGASGNSIGGTNAAARNVISGNGSSGIAIHDPQSNNNVIAGNYIGVNEAGTGVMSNTLNGIKISGGAQNNTIGGSSTGARNVVSGNKAQGIVFADVGTVGNSALGNLIGTNADGTSALGNGFYDPANHIFYAGVGILEGAQSNVIGGLEAGSANVISGNAASGISISGAGTNNNRVEGNYVGLNFAGTGAIGNGLADIPNNYRYPGVAIAGGAQGNVIGGIVSVAANVISGNGAQGVLISDAGSALNLILGNFIGLDAAGIGKIANGSSGIEISGGAQANTIGGTIAGSRNFISGNDGSGIAISGGGTEANLVRGNTIGLNVAGAAVANAAPGVALSSGAQSNVIGGTALGANNLISANQQEGIALFDSTTIYNVISQNSIFDNGARGIALYDDANNQQKFPSLSSAILSTGTNPGGTAVTGSLNSTPNTTFRIEFFANPVGDPSGFGEGRFFIGAANITTNSQGNRVFTANLGAAVPAGHFITAKAIDPDGNTSEHSAIRVVTATDNDGDGMPNNYENAHDFDPNLALDANLDTDGDGMTNLQEFKAGTDPRAAASRLHISSVDNSAGSAQITFQAAAGKSYRLEYRDDLASGTWNMLAHGIFTPTATSVQISDPQAATLSQRFYRICLEF